MAQQTAVEWLIKEIKNFDSGRSQYYNKAAIYDHAYRMEKEQISKAWDDGDYAYFHSKETGRDFDNGEQYYNETYNK